MKIIRSVSNFNDDSWFLKIVPENSISCIFFAQIISKMESCIQKDSPMVSFQVFLQIALNEIFMAVKGNI